MQEYEKIKSMNRLNETTIDLLHLMNEYRKKKSYYCPFSWQSSTNDRKRHMRNVSDLLLCKSV